MDEIQQAVKAADTNMAEFIMGGIITLLLGVLKIYFSNAHRNHNLAETLIRGIEQGGSKVTKTAVREIAAEAGQTEFLHRKVQTVVAEEANKAGAEATRSGAPREPHEPPEAPQSERRMGS